MDSSTINLTKFVMTESSSPGAPGSPGSPGGSPGTPDSEGGPPAYVNLGYEPSPNTDDKGNNSVSSNDIDDATAANTYANANASRLGEKVDNVDDTDITPDDSKPTSTATSLPYSALAAAAKMTTTSTTTATTSGGRKGSVGGSPAITAAYRHKDSSVGFRLPDMSARERRKSSVGALRGDSDQPYRGMSKEDLLRHSAKPFWRRLRYICMSVVMIGWLALIITVVALVLVYPRCRTPPSQNWWKKAVVYRIYVRSFQDHDGDGIGDLDGVKSQLGYLKEIGVTTISLSPLYPTSADADMDSAVTDHMAIAPEYGDIFKFIDLVNASHAHDIRVVLDFIPNHTGLDHPWFIESRSSSEQTNPKRNYYVWETGRGSNHLEAPNNWRSIYNDEAWFWGFYGRGQYYLHQFSTQQADLNIRSSEVREHLIGILDFWLNLGVDGFYVRDSGYLFEDYDIRHAVLLNNESDPELYESYDHVYTYGRSGIHDMFARWRAYLDDYGNKTARYRLLFADRTGDISDVMDYYGHFNRDGVHFPLNTFCLGLNASSDGRQVAGVVRQWINSMPGSRWPNWLGGTDSSERMIDRLGEQLIRPFITLIMLLPGTPMVYYGDEIGMRGLPMPNETEVDAGQRNLSMRSPMQWDNTSYAGFCRCTKLPPWMTLNPQYMKINVESQRADSSSFFQLFTNLTSLRRDYPSFHYGDYNEAVVDDDVFSFVRDFDGQKGFLVALNFANKTSVRTYRGAYPAIPTSATVSLRTANDVPYAKGDKISTSGVSLGPYQGVVLSWDYVAKEL